MTDYSRLRKCPMCGAETGQSCKVLSNYDGTLKPGDERPEPHFYRAEIGK